MRLDNDSSQSETCVEGWHAIIPAELGASDLSRVGMFGADVWETIKKTSETFRARCEKLLDMSIMCQEISKRGGGTATKKFNPNPSKIPTWRKHFWIRINSLMEVIWCCTSDLDIVSCCNKEA